MNGSMSSLPCSSSVARISSLLRTSTNSPARSCKLSFIDTHPRVLREALQFRLTRLHPVQRMQSGDVEHLFPAVNPIMTEQRTRGVPVANLLHAARLRHQPV